MINHQLIIASRGLVSGNICVVDSRTKKPLPKKIVNTPQEINSLISAQKNLISYLNKIKNKVGNSNTDVLDAHLAIVNDNVVFDEIKTEIKTKKLSAEYCVFEIFTTYGKQMENLNDNYMKERAKDFYDISSKLQVLLRGESIVDFSQHNKQIILVEYETTPSTLINSNGNIIGVVNVAGATTAHCVLVAKNLKIPMLVGLNEKAFSQLKSNMYSLLNGTNGEFVISPSKEEIDKFNRMVASENKLKQLAADYSSKNAITKDGVKVNIEANIGGLDDVKSINKTLFDGVGLFRTEFLFMESDHWPSEDEQYHVYVQIAKRLGKKPFVVRTLDIGGDKNLSYYQFEKELNPFLGHRAIRFCLANPKIFAMQIKALLRAAVHGNIYVMLPMISSIEEVVKSKQFIHKMAKELDKNNIANRIPKIGIMVEIPSVASAANLFAKEVDFFSIGTNDLIQYGLAVDRVNKEVAPLYQPLNPGILRLISSTILAAKKENIECAMCGSCAEDSFMIPFLIGCGLDSYSVSIGSLNYVKYIVNQCTTSDCQNLAQKMLTFSSVEKLKKLVISFYTSHSIMV